jgi:tetratricopeptide (TPR) repeat protein
MSRMQRAVVFGDTAEQARFIANMRGASDFPAQPAAGFITFTTGDLRLGRRLWRLIAEPSRSRDIRVLAYKTLAQIELMSGRRRAAQIELDSMALLDPAAALEHRALFSLWPLQQVSRGDLSALRDSLLRWKAEPGVGQPGSLVEHLPARLYLRLYLLGLLESRLGDHSASLRYAAELERRAGSAFSPAYVADLSRSVRAEVSRAQGRPEEALRTLQQASFWTRVDEEISGDSPFYAREYERLTRAELLYSVGRYSEALQQYRVLADNLFHSGAPAHLRMSEIYERQGEREKAADHHARFTELWKDSDPEVRSFLKSPVAAPRP